jgi:hypothetical protein
MGFVDTSTQLKYHFHGTRKVSCCKIWATATSLLTRNQLQSQRYFTLDPRNGSWTDKSVLFLGFKAQA